MDERQAAREWTGLTFARRDAKLDEAGDPETLVNVVSVRDGYVRGYRHHVNGRLRRLPFRCSVAAFGRDYVQRS